MILAKRFIGHVCIASAILAGGLSWHLSAMAAEPVATKGKALFTEYLTLKKHLEKNQFGIPLYLASQEKSSSLSVDVYGIFDYPFESVRDALQKPGNWCDIGSLLINVKACTFREESGQSKLTLYSGRKYFQLPNDAYKLDLNYRIVSLQQGYLEIELAGKNGPLDTRDHLIRLEAVPLAKDKTFIHFHLNYSFGVLAGTAMRGYYATKGRKKKGFSVSATDARGDPVYLNGAGGSLERSAVRMYFAIQTYMDTLEFPRDLQFEHRINRWYDLTARFPRQLYEIGKEEYLSSKRREHANQLILQHKFERN